MKCLRDGCPRVRYKEPWEVEGISTHCCVYCFNDDLFGHTKSCEEAYASRVDLFGFGVDPENPERCIICKGSGADPDDPGDWVPEAGMHNPYTGAPCSMCLGSGKRAVTHNG